MDTHRPKTSKRKLLMMFLIGMFLPEVIWMTLIRGKESTFIKLAQKRLPKQYQDFSPFIFPCKRTHPNPTNKNERKTKPLNNPTTNVRVLNKQLYQLITCPYLRKNLPYHDGYRFVREITRHKLSWTQKGNVKTITYGKVPTQRSTHTGDRLFVEVRFDNGTLAAKAFYQKGTCHGLFQTRHRNGQMSSQRHFKNNLPHGPSQKWYKHGVLKQESLYQHGILIKRKRFTPKGKAKSQGSYNKEQATYTEISASGALLERYSYKGFQKTKQIIYEAFYPNGQLKRFTPYVNGQAQGYASQWYPSGALRQVVHYHKGQYHGALRTWDTQNRLTFEGHYLLGIPHGRSFWSSAKDKSYTIQHYALNKRHGSYTSDNPEYHSHRHYRHDKPDGSWIYLDKKTQTRLEQHYKESQKHGEYKMSIKNNLIEKGAFIQDQCHGTFSKWSNKGKLLLRSTYKRGRLVQEKIYPYHWLRSLLRQFTQKNQSD